MTAARSLLSATVVALLVAGCGGPGTAPAPQPGESTGFPPDLRGRRVMLLPIQRIAGVGGDPSAELAFALTDRSEEIEWVLEAEVREVLERSPAIQADTRGLPVSIFLQAEVDRVGDPLYGQLRRMAGLVNADAIVLPVMASFEANPQIPGSAPRVRLTAAILEPRAGRVMWFGVEEGEEHPRGDPRGLASAADRLARTILWYAFD